MIRGFLSFLSLSFLASLFAGCVFVQKYGLCFSVESGRKGWEGKGEKLEGGRERNDIPFGSFFFPYAASGGRQSGNIQI